MDDLAELQRRTQQAFSDLDPDAIVSALLVIHAKQVKLTMQYRPSPQTEAVYTDSREGWGARDSPFSYASENRSETNVKRPNNRR